MQRAVYSGHVSTHFTTPQPPEKGYYFHDSHFTGEESERPKGVRYLAWGHTATTGKSGFQCSADLESVLLPTTLVTTTTASISGLKPPHKPSHSPFCDCPLLSLHGRWDIFTKCSSASTQPKLPPTLEFFSSFHCSQPEVQSQPTQTLLTLSSPVS